MADSKKMPVSVYQIDSTIIHTQDFDETVDFIMLSVNRGGDKFQEEQLKILDYKEFEIRTFSLIKQYKPRWAKFIGAILNEESRINYCVNQTNSFICFIKYDKHVFAITGGTGAMSIDKFINQNFGLEILVRLFTRESKVIKSIQDRGVTGIILGQTKFYRGDQRFSDENGFGKIFKQVKAELNRKLLTQTFGFSDDELQRRKLPGCLENHHFKLTNLLTLTH